MFLAVLLGTMTVVTFGQVVARYVFHSGWLAALEFTTILFGWLVMFGISYGVRIGTHLGVDVFVRMFPKPVFRACALFGVLASILYAVILLYADWLRDLFGFRTHGGAIDYWQRMYQIGIGLEDLKLPEPIMKFIGFQADTLPRWLAYIMLPLGLALFALRSLQAGWMIITGKRETMIASHEGEDLVAEVNILKE